MIGEQNAPKLDKLGTKTDHERRAVDWQNNDASGYLMHIREGGA